MIAKANNPRVRILRSPLAAKLGTAFVAVAIGAVLVFAGLTLWRTKHTVRQLANDRREATTEAIAETIALGYQQTGAWSKTDIHPAAMLAVQADASIIVADTTGTVLALPTPWDE